jgi:hypothetical protein
MSQSAKEKNIKSEIILKRLDEIQQEIYVVENKFNFTTDPILLESYIYELKSLNIKFGSYIKLCKKYKITFSYK